MIPTPFIVNGILITIFIIIAFRLLYVVIKMDRKNKLEKIRIEQENEQLAAYIKNAEKKVDEMQTFAREYNEIVRNVGEYLDHDDIQSLSKYVKTITFPGTTRDEEAIEKLRSINSSGVRGILYFKVIQANNMGLNVVIDIGGRITDIAMEEMDLIRVLGVLLDNAIEESVKTKDKKLYIGVYQEEDYSSTVLKIGNTYVDIPDKNKMFDKGYTTKGGNRGTGLYGARLILNKYPASLTPLIERDLLIMELYIHRKRR